MEQTSPKSSGSRRALDLSPQAYFFFRLGREKTSSAIGDTLENKRRGKKSISSWLVSRQCSSGTLHLHQVFALLHWFRAQE